MNKATHLNKIILALLMLTSQHLFAQVQSKTWNGSVSSDWFENANWTTTQTFNENNPEPVTVFIINVPVRNGHYPVISGRAATADSIKIMNNARLTVLDTLEINRTISNNGIFDVSDGTLKLNAHTLELPNNLFYQNRIKNLILGFDAIITLPASFFDPNAGYLVSQVDSLTGTLTLSEKSRLNTNGNLLIRSTATGTARIAEIPEGATISGEVIIERYIPAKTAANGSSSPAWRLLSVPLSSTNAPTIHEAWQENATYSSRPDAGNSMTGSNPNPGYGVHVIGVGGNDNGFDTAISSNYSIKYYDNATNTLKGVSTTNEAITNYPGYMLYVRGDRSINLSQLTNAAVKPTTLRVKGTPVIGNKIISVSPTNFTLLPNPYASAIDFGALTRTGVLNSFYAWDPKAGGNFGLGAYVTVSANEMGTYDVSTSNTSISQYIPSGEAVFVKADNNEIGSRSVLIKETAKTILTNESGLFGRFVAPGQSVRTNLYAYNSDGTNSLLDGALTTYSSRGSNDIDNFDAEKLFGSSESIALTRKGKVLSIERRQTITGVDTTFINVSKLKRLTYKLSILTENMNTTGMFAVIKDNYNASNNNRTINLNGTTSIDFTVDNNPASYATNRFSIVFVKRAPLSETLNGKNTSTETEVKTPAIDQSQSVVVFPNPVTTNEINIKTNNLELGNYELKLYNLSGQLVTSKSVKVTSKSSVVKIKVPSGFSAGKYEIKIDGQGKSINTSVLKQ